jgi:RimJ/RimL family protein N-acetyltransferase
VDVRPAQPDDADAIGEVHVRAWQAAYRGVMPDAYLDGLRPEERADMWRRHLAALPADRRLDVITEGDQVVGFAGFGPSDDPAVGELYAINIDPDVWGQGFGQTLLAAVTVELAAAGYPDLVLWVVPQNERARRVYEAAGWQTDGATRDQDVLGVVVPEVRYRRATASG